MNNNVSGIKRTASSGLLPPLPKKSKPDEFSLFSGRGEMDFDMMLKIFDFIPYNEKYDIGLVNKLWNKATYKRMMPVSVFVTDLDKDSFFDRISSANTSLLHVAIKPIRVAIQPRTLFGPSTTIIEQNIGLMTERLERLSKALYANPNIKQISIRINEINLHGLNMGVFENITHRLSALELIDNQLTGGDISSFGIMKQLKYLAIDRNKIDNIEESVFYEKFPNLEFLFMYRNNSFNDDTYQPRSQISQQLLQAISRSETLLGLNITGGEIDDSGIRVLGSMPKLNYFWLNQNMPSGSDGERIVNAIIQNMSHLKFLEYAGNYHGNNFNETFNTMLKEALPDTQFSTGGTVGWVKNRLFHFSSL